MKLAPEQYRSLNPRLWGQRATTRPWRPLKIPFKLVPFCITLYIPGTLILRKYGPLETLLNSEMHLDLSFMTYVGATRITRPKQNHQRKCERFQI